MKRCSLVWALALTTATLTGCGDDSTGPSAGLSASDFLDAAGEALASIGGAIQGNEASATLSVLGFYITNVTSQATLSSPSGIARIPDGALGGTFYFDGDLYQYVLDEGASGAPADGARFLLYEIDENTYQPVVPLNQIGHIDIRDLSGTTLDVRHVVVINGATVLTFNVTGVATETSVDLTTTGTVDDGTLQADFTFDIEASSSGLQINIDASSGTYQLVWDYVRGPYDYGPGSDNIRLTDSQSGGKIEMIINWDSNYLATTGSVVEFNDRVVADITGSGGYVEVTPRSGSGLDEFDGYLLSGGYFELFYLESYFVQLTAFGLENAGVQFPYY